MITLDALHSDRGESSITLRGIDNVKRIKKLRDGDKCYLAFKFPTSMIMVTVKRVTVGVDGRRAKLEY